MAQVELFPGESVEITPLSELTSEPFEPTVEVRKITDVELLREIIGFILDKESTMTLNNIYTKKHSPLRTQLFLIKMEITTEVSVHLVRHAAVGQFHYVSSNRADWGDYEPEEVNRLTPVRHVMLLNAEHLMDMAAQRLCTKALKATREVMNLIVKEVAEVDPALASKLVPKCFRQGGMCFEDNPCGVNLRVLRQIVEQIPENVYRDWRNQYIMDNYKTPKEGNA